MICMSEKEHPMVVSRERTMTFGITVKDEDGNDYVLGESEKLVFALKKDPSLGTKITDEPVVLTKELATAEDSYVLTIQPDDTTALNPGRYLYDVHIESGTERIPVIEISPFYLKPNVG